MDLSYEDTQRLLDHLFNDVELRSHDWGQWATQTELETMTDVELHELAHGAQAFMDHRSDEF